MALRPGSTYRPTNPYQESYTHTRLVRDFVIDSVGDARDWADKTQRDASRTLADLRRLRFDFDRLGDPPPRPDMTPMPEFKFEMPDLDSTSFGDINVGPMPGVSLRPIYTPGALNIKPYQPTPLNLEIPNAPKPGDYGDAPDAPTLQERDVPLPPELLFPNMPNLEQIKLPVFDPDKLPVWDKDTPEFQGSPIAPILQWVEPEYKPEVLHEVVGLVRKVWAGSNGLPAAIEQAIRDRVADQQDRDVRQAISEIRLDFSRRGYVEPHGAQTAREDEVRRQAALAKQAANRDLAIEATRIQIENVRWAAEQAVAAETVFYNIHNNMAQRSLQAAQATLEAQLAYYNAQVNLFNARMSALSIEAEVYRTRLQGEISILQAQIEAELAKGTLNEQRVRVYAEQIRAVLGRVEVYQAEIAGVNAFAEQQRNRIERYRAEVQAYGEKVQADKVRFDAYDSRIRGELGKAQIADAEARGYASYVSGQAAIADVDIKRMDADIRTNEQLIQKYRADLERTNQLLRSQVAKIEANASAYTAGTQRLSAEAQAQSSVASAQIAGYEAQMRVGISHYETETRRYIALMEQQVREAQVQLEALKSAGAIASTIAAGAMSGINIGAHLSGSGSVAASGASQTSDAVSRTQNYNVGLDADKGPIPTRWESM